MLHEVFLALSGLHSPLLDSEKSTAAFPHITPAELDLLQSIRRLSYLHRELRRQLPQITGSKKHPTICRAVSQRLLDHQLTGFRHHILAVEAKILKKDPSTVGAYNIVPLATIVGQFDEWRRRMEWFWAVTSFISPPHDVSKRCSGAQLLDYLSNETKTGYPDIEKEAVDLLKVAELAWLRHVSTWLLSTKQPPSDDLFISQTSADIFSIDTTKVPAMLSPQTAASILFIGKTLRALEVSQAGDSSSSVSTFRVTSSVKASYELVKPLVQLPSPLTSSRLSLAVSEIRSTLARRLIDGPLPVRRLVGILSSLQDFFLIQRPGFAEALIQESDGYLRSRHAQTRSSKTGLDLAGAMMTETEVRGVLQRSWIALAPSFGREQALDSRLEWAREHLQLKLFQPPQSMSTDQEQQPSSHGSLFADFLLPLPTHLTMPIAPPTDLFLSHEDLQSYSSIHAYLLSLHRAHIHLTSLWRTTRLRKPHPAPTGPPRSNRPRVLASIQKLRHRNAARYNSMRPVWSSLGSVVYFLTELSNYLTTDVVAHSQASFQSWLSTEAGGSTSPASRPSSSAADTSSTAPQKLPLDPELLTSSHRLFLTTLTSSLLLTDEPYCRSLRSLLKQTDAAVALVQRLADVQAALDLAEEGVVTADADVADSGEKSKQSHAAQEALVLADLKAVCARCEAAMAAVVARLREVDLRRVTAGPSVFASLSALKLTMTLGGDDKVRGREETTPFEPWLAAGVDKLLMRLDLKTAREVAALSMAAAAAEAS